MKKIYSKLNNNDGKTILMALFLLLVAVVVSVVVITAASTAAHQLNDNKEAQQAYLTVSSAAQLFRDEIDGKSYEHTRTTFKPISPNAGNKDSETKETVPSGTWGDLITAIARDIMNGNLGNGTSEYKAGNINISTNDSDATFDGVSVKIYVQQAGTSNDVTSGNVEYYDMDIAFEASGKSSDEYGYKMNLAVRIEKTRTITETTLTEDGWYNGWYNQKKWTATTTKTTITFGSGILTRDGINTDGGVQ